MAGLHGLRHASAWLIVPVLVSVFVSGHHAAGHDQALTDDQPHRSVTVVEAERSPLAGRAEGPEISVDLGHRTAVLGLSFPGENDVVPGDRLEVVLDPDDPEHVIATTSHDDWAYTWWGELLLALGIGVFGGGSWLLWSRSVPRRPARAAVRRARNVQAVDLVVVEGRRLGLRDGQGNLWSWTADEDSWPGQDSGNLRVVGELRDGEWPVVADGRRLHRPGGPVRLTTSG